MSNSEPHKNYTVKITLPNGSIRTVRELATTEWHAIDKAYSKYNAYQENRAYYIAVAPMIRVR